MNSVDLRKRCDPASRGRECVPVVLRYTAFAVYRKDDIFLIAKQAGHQVLFLPAYSPDFNHIEQDFAILKKRRIDSAPGISLDDIVKSYGNYLE